MVKIIAEALEPQSIILMPFNFPILDAFHRIMHIFANLQYCNKVAFTKTCNFSEVSSYENKAYRFHQSVSHLSMLLLQHEMGMKIYLHLEESVTVRCHR